MRVVSLTGILLTHRLESLVRNFNHVFHKVLKISRLFFFLYYPSSSDSKESACSVGDPSLIPGLGRSPGEGNENLCQYSCLENPKDREEWRATVHGVRKSQTQWND